MSFYGIEADQIEDWRSRRKAQLIAKFGDAVYKEIGGSPWQHEVEVRLGDAADKQARAERLAYMRGEPVPSDTEILSELLAWVRSGDCKRGGSETLSSLTTLEEAKMPKTINEGLVALATLMGQANPSHSVSESIKAGLARLDNTWSPPLQLACKLLDVESFGLISGNTHRIQKVHGSCFANEVRIPSSRSHSRWCLTRH